MTRSVIVPDACVPLLKEQRTNHANVQAEYGDTIRKTYLSIAPYLPKSAERVMDIGCGMAGIDVHLSEHYGHDVELWLVDKGGVSPRINCGYYAKASEFSHYHDWNAALSLLDANQVPLDNIRCVDLLHEPFPAESFDVVISLLSMGFHYPVNTHPIKVKPGGVFIADVRINSDNWSKIPGNWEIVYESSKYRRIVSQC